MPLIRPVSMARALRRLLYGLGLLVGTSGLAPGCAAVRAGIEVQGAARAQAEATAAGAAERAPYEHAMAGHYLDKAWEELGGRQHRDAVELARTSRQWSELTEHPPEASATTQPAPEAASQPAPEAPTQPAPEAPIQPAPEAAPELP